MNRPTIVFGLDGACFEFIQPWLDAGHLPTLADLIEAGGKSRLESCVPATTPPAWTSMTTGVNPGKHGIFGFYRRNRGHYDIDPVSDRDVRARRLWDYTSDADQTSLVVNVPVTHPARELDGALVPGYLAPEDPATYPEELLERLDPDYQVYADSEAADVPEDQLCSEWLELTDARKDIALELMGEHDWDHLFLEFQKTDGAVHKFDDEMNIRRIYERVDECMAEILEATDVEPNVFVVSDHGIGQPKEWSVALNTWLVEQGYAETTTGTESGNDESWLTDATDDASGGSASTSPVSRLLSGLGRVGLTKQRLERALSTVGLYEAVATRAPDGAGGSLEEEVIDEAASKAFYQGMGFSGVDIGVTINEEQFYDAGTVSEADYEAVRTEVMDALQTLEGPDGANPFTQVRPREAIYEGDATEFAPDIVLEQDDDYVIGSSKPRGQTFIPAEDGRIDHTRHGLLVAAGPDIEPDWSVGQTPSIMDVTPTLLALAGVALDERFDGEPLVDVFAEAPAIERREYGPIETGDAYAFSDDEEAALEERLGAMGYME
ncbi:alkaline phosphatase family protein [Natronomonas halophila]|uniref:alkaline phosphatase family protein n=1 Tax=Natronomonas halophila TaxID=2747817 RepID=UPI0015B58A20|nr:alkaline phosphatase family protein [Natronomonas halophila]QLD87082.1 alkaline phosphatase family protein [Natronomonas halophila]